MRNLSLLTAKQAVNYSEELSIRIVFDLTDTLERCLQPDFYSCIWKFLGISADFTGFQDDFGEFIPVDWC